MHQNENGVYALEQYRRPGIGAIREVNFFGIYFPSKEQEVNSVEIYFPTAGSLSTLAVERAVLTSGSTTRMGVEFLGLEAEQPGAGLEPPVLFPPSLSNGRFYPRICGRTGSPPTLAVHRAVLPQGCGYNFRGWWQTRRGSGRNAGSPATFALELALLPAYLR